MKAVHSVVLTPRERAVVGLLASGLTVKAAAARIHVGTRTATDYLESARQRLGVSTTYELVAVVVRAEERAQQQRRAA